MDTELSLHYHPPIDGYSNSYYWVSGEPTWESSHWTRVRAVDVKTLTNNTSLTINSLENAGVGLGYQFPIRCFKDY